MKIKLDRKAYRPTRAHETDAGLDIRAMHDGVVPAKGSATFKTGIRVELPSSIMGDIRPKSGLMFNHDILTFGTVDEGFSGEIMVHMFNLGKIDYQVLRGDKIAQLVTTRVVYEPVEVSDEISGGERGSNGYGSTGR
jgi:dUTP pyrophosphatase